MCVGASGGVWTELHVPGPVERRCVGGRRGELRPAGAGQL